MTHDEQAIRKLIEEWHRTTAKGELPEILKMMDEDVVFLVPGKPPMRGRDAFAASFKTATQQFRIKSSSDIQEIHVNGSWAYVWNYLSVTMFPINDGPPRQRAGNVLSVLRKQANGDWVMFRDANLLAENSAS